MKPKPSQSPAGEGPWDPLLQASGSTSTTTDWSELTGLGRRYGSPGVSQQVRAGSDFGKDWERGTGIGVSGIRGVAGWRNSW